VSDFRKLRVWENAQAIAVEAHRIAESMHGARSAGLRDQLSRAAMSVPSNIVEGSAHSSPREFARFLQYAIASVSEVEGHLQLGRDLDLVSHQDFASLHRRIVDERRMLHGLLKAVKCRGEL
jgi:four helix bundle protein